MAAIKKKTAKADPAPVKAEQVKPAAQQKPQAPVFYYLEQDDGFPTEGDEVLESLPQLISYETGIVQPGQEPEGAELFKTQAQLDKRTARADKKNETELERSEKATASLGVEISTGRTGIVGGR